MNGSLNVMYANWLLRGAQFELQTAVDALADGGPMVAAIHEAALAYVAAVEKAINDSDDVVVVYKMTDDGNLVTTAVSA